MVPFPPAIVAVPIPLSNNLCRTTAPPNPNNLNRTPPIKRTRVVASSRTAKLGIAYSSAPCPSPPRGRAEATRSFSIKPTSSHAPQTVYTGTESLSSPDKRAGNSERAKKGVVVEVVGDEEAFEGGLRINDFI